MPHLSLIWGVPGRKTRQGLRQTSYVYVNVIILVILPSIGNPWDVTANVIRRQAMA